MKPTIFTWQLANALGASRDNDFVGAGLWLGFARGHLTLEHAPAERLWDAVADAVVEAQRHALARPHA